MVCELNDITAALNIYVIKGCHQLGTEPNRGCFSPVFIFIFRKWAGLSPILEGYRVLVTCLVVKGPLSQELGGTWGCQHTYDSRESSRLFFFFLASKIAKSPRNKCPFPESRAVTEAFSLLGGQLRGRKLQKWPPLYQGVFCRTLILGLTC